MKSFERSSSKYDIWNLFQEGRNRKPFQIGTGLDFGIKQKI
jgi:hypothetical protein